MYRKRIQHLVNEEVKRQLNEVGALLTTAGVLAGAKAYDYFSNRGKKSNPTDGRWILNTTQEIGEALQQAVASYEVAPNIAWQAMQLLTEVYNTLQESGVKKYNPNDLNLSMGDLDPTGILYNGFKRSGNGGSFF